MVDGGDFTLSFDDNLRNRRSIISTYNFRIYCSLELSESNCSY
jgi:hypothetical protein